MNENTKQNCSKFLDKIDAQVFVAMERIANNYGRLESMEIFEDENWD